MHPRIHGRTSISIEGVRLGLNLSVRFHFALLTLCLLSLTCAAGFAQSPGTSGIISGVVLDPTGAVIQGAAVTIDNPVSQFQRMETSNASGEFRFTNVPFNPYHMTITMQGFTPESRDIDLNSAIPLNVKISLKISAGTQTVTVTTQPNDLIEKTPTNHTDIDRAMFSKLPLESQSSSLSSLVTLASPGIAADSNGLFHGMGNHASNSFSVDGQPITDQQSKIFFQSDSRQRRAVDGSDSGGAAGGIRG